MSKIIPISQKKRAYTDQAIYQGLLSNQREVIAYLYQEIYPLASAQLGKMGANEDDIKDMFQEGMVALWKNVQLGKFQLRSDTKLSTYLVGICKNKWLEKRRKAQNRKESGSDQVPEGREEASFLEQWFQEEELGKLRLHFHQLSERCQQFLRRFYFERESMKQIALAFDINEATAKNEKYRCMQRLKLRFQAS